MRRLVAGLTAKLRQPSLFTAALAGAGLTFALINFTQEAPRINIGDGNSAPINIVAASGLPAFPVETFCMDPMTEVLALPAPDSSATTFQLLRVRGGVPESLVWIEGNAVGTHFYQGADIQQSNVASVSAAAVACILRKSAE